MKRTAYVVKGQSFDEPGTLPAGFEVEQVEVEDPQSIRRISPDGGRWLDLTDQADGTVQVTMGSGELVGWRMLLSPGSAREVRDWLSTVLGDEPKPKRRVLKEPNDGDLWFELEPNHFTYGQSFEGAQERRDAEDRDFIDYSEAKLNDRYGRMVDVTDVHAEVNA